MFEILFVSAITFLGAPLIAMSAHSIPTVLHSLGVSNTARKFSKILGMNLPMRLYITMNAVYHDVGKLGIPVSVLHKKGRLTDEERKIINKHTSNAIAKCYGFFFPAAIGHHKNFLGDGYGAEKVQSSISAIIEICDVYDAVCGYFRTYTEPRTKEQVIDIMNCEKAKFDPDLFKCFMEHFDCFKPSIITIWMDGMLRKARHISL